MALARGRSCTDSYAADSWPISRCCITITPTDTASSTLSAPTAAGASQRRSRFTDQRASAGGSAGAAGVSARPTAAASTRPFIPAGRVTSGADPVSRAEVS